MKRKSKTIQFADGLHSRIKQEAARRRRTLEFFAAQLVRAGFRAYKIQIPK